jgi:hypothetical protein
MKIVLLIVGGAAAIVMAVIVYGAVHWQASTQALIDRLEAARTPVDPSHYDPRELEGLPPPVQRYFRAVLEETQPLVAAVSLAHTGTFNTSESNETWRSFSSTQRVITARPGFVWDARIAMLPGVAVRVHDAYVAGEGILHATLFGLLSVAKLRGTEHAAQGELMRFMAEAAWYPTTLLPSQGVQWHAVNDSSAKATMKDGDITVSLLFHFNDKGLIDSVHAESRWRAVNGDLIATPWQGRFWNYEQRDGMRVPLEGEVAWLLPAGPQPYWRGRIESIGYEFAP